MSQFLKIYLSTYLSIIYLSTYLSGFLGGLGVKNQPALQEMWVQILVWEDSHGTPLQYSYWENPMDRGAWQATAHGVTKVRHDWSDLACTHLRIICLSPVDLVSLESCDWRSTKITLKQVRRTCAPWKQRVCLEHLYVSTMKTMPGTCLVLNKHFLDSWLKKCDKDNKNSTGCYNSQKKSHRNLKIKL